MSTDEEEELEVIEQILYKNCKKLIDNYQNISIRIDRNIDEIKGNYRKSITETSTKLINIDNDKFDF